MKIAFTRFPFESAFGGLEKINLDLASGFAGFGDEVVFYTNCPILLAHNYRREGVNYEMLSYPRPPVSKWSLISFTLFLPFTLLKSYFLAGRMKREGISACIMLSLGEKLVLTPFLIRLGIKVVWAEHERVGAWLFKNPYLGLYRRLAQKVRVVSVSHVLHDELIHIGVESTVIENGLDTEFWIPAHDIPGGSSPILNLVTNARLTEGKGIMNLLEALTSAPIGNSQLIVVGDGPEKLKLTKYAGENNLAVEFVGQKSSQEIRTIYETTDLAVFPSVAPESFGMAPLEAMSMGVPVVASNMFASLSGIQTSGVYIYEASDSEALKQSILSAIHNCNEPDNGRILRRQVILDKYSLTKMVEAYRKLCGR